MTVCSPPYLGKGTCVLSDSTLGDLALDCEEGFVLVSIAVGFPGERAVVRPRSLADGVFDDTAYLGSRAITVTVRLDHRVASTQTLIDRLMPYLSPRRRPTITWSLPDSPTDFRQATIRGVDAPLVINGPKYRTIVASWVTDSAYLVSPTEECVEIDPLDPPEEEGREYDLEFDRLYIPTPPVGGLYVLNAGTAPAHWRATIFADATDPFVTVRNDTIAFDQNGGVTLITGQTIVIDTLERTILLNGDPLQSRYDRTNFEDWSWDDLLLQPGLNLVRIQGTGFNFSSRLRLCWRSSYL